MLLRLLQRLNAFFLITFNVFGKRISFKLMHPLNASSPMISSPSGKIIVSRARQFSNKLGDNSFTPLGNWIFSRFVQLLKIPSPKFFMESGSEMLFNEEQFKKAKSWISVSFSENFIFFKDEQLQKAELLIVFTVWSISTSSICELKAYLSVFITGKKIFNVLSADCKTLFLSNYRVINLFLSIYKGVAQRGKRFLSNPLSWITKTFLYSGVISG